MASKTERNLQILADQERFDAIAPAIQRRKLKYTGRYDLTADENGVVSPRSDYKAA